MGCCAASPAAHGRVHPPDVDRRPPRHRSDHGAVRQRSKALRRRGLESARPALEVQRVVESRFGTQPDRRGGPPRSPRSVRRRPTWTAGESRPLDRRKRQSDHDRRDRQPRGPARPAGPRVPRRACDRARLSVARRSSRSRPTATASPGLAGQTAPSASCASRRRGPRRITALRATCDADVAGPRAAPQAPATTTIATDSPCIPDTSGRLTPPPRAGSSRHQGGLPPAPNTVFTTKTAGRPPLRSRPSRR